MVVTASDCGDSILQPGTGKLVKVDGKMDGAIYRAAIKENMFQTAKDLRLVWRFTYWRIMTLNIQPTMEWFRLKHINILEWLC